MRPDNGETECRYISVQATLPAFRTAQQGITVVMIARMLSGFALSVVLVSSGAANGAESTAKIAAGDQRMISSMRLRAAGAVLGLLVTAFSTPLKADGSPGQPGLVLAQEYCSACHRVSAEQAPPPRVIVSDGVTTEEYEAPSFSQIAARPGRDADYLRTYIQAPHYPMREQMFIPEELEQIVIYILSLKDADSSAW